jgi:hypothetical protein
MAATSAAGTMGPDDVRFVTALAPSLAMVPTLAR